MPHPTPSPSPSPSHPHPIPISLLMSACPCVLLPWNGNTCPKTLLILYLSQFWSYIWSPDLLEIGLFSLVVLLEVVVIGRSGWLLASGIVMSGTVFSLDGICCVSDLVVISNGISRASTALTGRTCSGAARIRYPTWLQNTVRLESCWTTLAGPIHMFWLSPVFHTMTHSPAS